jgi:CRISPR-associated endonuclease/helicase Cas3
MKNEIIAFYKKTFGVEFVPYLYQIKVAEALLLGKNIILQVPTGAGKTWASIVNSSEAAPLIVGKQHHFRCQ